MLGRKIFTAFLVSILTVVVLTTIEVVINDPTEGFSEVAFVLSIFVVPVVFVYGILTSTFSELMSAKRTRSTHLTSLLLHVLFGLILFILLNLANSFMWMNVASFLLFGSFGAVFFYVDRMLKYAWDKSEHKTVGEK